MKVILTGSTGFIGGEVLSQCLQDPGIRSVVAISRRDLPAHEKLEVALTEDFLSYPDSIRDQIKDADACIWYNQPQPILSGVCCTNLLMGRWVRLGCLIMRPLDV